MRLGVLCPAMIIFLSACGDGSRTLQECEQGSAALTAGTIDGLATIAEVELVSQGGTCLLGSACMPRADAPCAEVSIIGFPIGVTCMLTFTSTAGATATGQATLESSGDKYACLSGGTTITASSAVFTPGRLSVDFSASAAEGDAAAPTD
jgi:hypothetical protein